MQKLEELERKEEEEAARERHKQEMLIAEAKKAAKKKEEEEFRKRVIEDAKREEYEKELKEKKKKEEEDKMFKARLKDMYLAQGYSEESIENMIKDAEKKRKGSHGRQSPHSPHALVGGHDSAMLHTQKEMNVVNLSKPTYLKVHRKHLSPDTLDAYDLPWEWDEVSFDPLSRSIYMGNADPFHSAIRIISSSSDGSARTIRISCLTTRES